MKLVAMGIWPALRSALETLKACVCKTTLIPLFDLESLFSWLH